MVLFPVSWFKNPIPIAHKEFMGIQWIQELYPETFAYICAQLKKQVFETKDFQLCHSTVVVGMWIIKWTMW